MGKPITDREIKKIEVNGTSLRLYNQNDARLGVRQIEGLIRGTESRVAENLEVKTNVEQAEQELLEGILEEFQSRNREEFREFLVSRLEEVKE